MNTASSRKRFLYLWVVSCLFLPTVVFGDILVRYPVGLAPASTAALSEAIGRVTGKKVVGISTQPAALQANQPPPVPAGVSERLMEAAAAYKRLELDGVFNILRDVEVTCVQASSFATCRAALFDAAMLRGMSLAALGRSSEAEVEFRNAHIAHPREVPDPKTYSPSILRAFAAACADAESRQQVEIHLKVEPPDALLFVDGDPVPARNLSLTPGRHVIEGRSAGFADTARIIEAAPVGDAAQSFRLTLPPLADPEAWEVLSSEVSKDQWSPGDPGFRALMTRFRIDWVLLLSYLPGGTSMAVRLARKAKRDLSDLPALNAPWTPLPGDFQAAVKTALGIPTIAPSQEPSVGPLSPGTVEEDAFADDDESDLDDEDEAEDPSVQFQPDAEPPIAREKKNIFKSPWFWISVGAVVSIVSGVVIAVQVQD